MSITERILLGLVIDDKQMRLCPNFQGQEAAMSRGLLNLVNQSFSEGVWKLRVQRLSIPSGLLGSLPPTLSSLLLRPD